MSHRSGPVALCLLILLLIGLPAVPALAVITRLTPLRGVIDDSDHIAIATVEAMDPARPSMTLSIAVDLKGAATARRMPVLLKGGPESSPKLVLDRVKVGTQIVIFLTDGPEQILVNAFTEGSWFQIIGTVVEGTPRWGFTHGEPYLRRTFKGTTDEMKATIEAYLKEKQEPPPASPNEAPGFGPTLGGIAFEPWVAEKGTDTKPTPTDVQETKTMDSPVTSASPSESGSKMWIIVGVVALVLVIVLSLVLRRKSA